ncbi:MAG: hypothetical protein WCL10_19500 [Novosphingobium sp.]|uniref:hypothetical protein n=1 Tax=Novosphingobium sp. TaxID=1874826 RepID=UPI0030163112
MRATFGWRGVGLALALWCTGPGQAHAQEAAAAQQDDADTYAKAFKKLKSVIRNTDTAPLEVSAVSAEASVSRRSARPRNPLLLSDKALATEVMASTEDRDNFEPTPEFSSFDKDLRAGLKKAPLPALVASMAPRYGMAPDALRDLVRDLLIARVSGYDLSNSGELKAYRPAFVTAVARHVAAAGHATLALEIASAALNSGGICTDTDFAPILASAPDKALANWGLARGFSCPKLIDGALASPEKRTSALIMLLTSNEVQGFQAISPEAWLLDKGGLDRVEAADRPALRLWLVRALIDQLLDAGLADEALVRFDAQDAQTQAALLQPRLTAFSARIDGGGFAFGASDTDLRPRLAAAMVLGGRKREAAALLEGDPAYAERLALVDCLYAGAAVPPAKDGPSSNCGLDGYGHEGRISQAVATRYVREAIDQTGADLYPLVEVGVALNDGQDTSGVMVLLRCKLLTEAQYTPLCRKDRASVASGVRREDYNKAEIDAHFAAIAAAGFPGWADVAARHDAWRVATLAAFTDAGPQDQRTAWADREAIEPDPAPFPEKPLPPALHSKRNEDGAGPAWPRGWAKLPQGFMPVRTGISGALAVAVSRSGRFDPSGEVGAGGYWVHVSRNSGKTWGPPLYTGLADSFPYVVPASSRLPLLDGETIRLEVEVALLDTRSITYPPVGLRTRRKARDLYLEMPMAAMQADRDGDGLTDIAAHHLLLDQAAPTAPFVVGSDGSRCGGVADPQRQVRAQLLMRLIGGRQDQALLEGIDKPADAPFGFGWAQMPTAETWPLFIKGDPADYACMALPVPAFVYGAAGEAALQRKTPDFRLLDAPPMIMNRSGTRGFSRWSLGWTGGTTLVLRKGERWLTIELHSWIT